MLSTGPPPTVIILIPRMIIGKSRKSLSFCPGAARQLVDLTNEDRDRISGLGRAAASTLRVHQAMMGRPITTSGWLVGKTGITPATVNKCLGHLERLSIVRELTSRKCNRVFSYAGYLEIMNQGTELPG